MALGRGVFQRKGGGADQTQSIIREEFPAN